MIVLIIIATIITKLLGSIFTVRFRDKLHIILGFSAGTMLAVALFDILPEAIEMTEKVYSIGVVMMLVIFGYSIYMLVDRLFSLHDHDACDKSSHKGVFSISAIIFHSFLDGLSIGLAFHVSDVLGLSVALAVLAHSFSDGVNAAGLVMKDESDKKVILLWSLINSLAPVLGLLIAFFIVIPEPVLGLLLAIVAGLFLYISTSDLLPEAHHRHSSLWTTLSTLFGMVLIIMLVNMFGV